MKRIFVTALLLLSLVLFMEIGEAMSLRGLCGTRCSRDRAQVSRQCRRSLLVRTVCVIRGCSRRRVQCVLRGNAAPSPSISVTPSSTPSVTPSPSPSSSQTPSPSPIPTPATGYTWGDPHVSTYDGSRFDCQGAGEFILAKSEATPEFEVQGRFRESTGHSFTLSSGIAVKDNSGAVLVQASLARVRGTPSTTFGSCSVVFAIDGSISSTPISSGTTMVGLGLNTAITIEGNKVTFNLPSGLRVQVSVLGGFGCYFGRMVVTIPGQTIAKGPVFGLLGTPNDRKDDDFRNRDGDILPSPENLRGSAATEYCMANWAVNSQQESLFTLERGERPVVPVATPSLTVAGPNLNAAPQVIRDICGDNEECLIDGILGDEQLARGALEEEQAAETLSLEPLGIPVGPSNGPIVRDIQRQAKKDNGLYYTV